MIKPDGEILRAIAGQRHSSQWDTIVQWMRDSLIDQSLRNNYLTGEYTIKGQGRALELDELLNYIDKAEEYLHKKEG
jgi:hypothetical protein